MALSYKQILNKFLKLLPIFFLFFISFNGNSLIDLKFFTINIQYILIYYWVLRRPEALGFGFIFIAGIVTDVVMGSPMGLSGLSMLVVAGAATYIRVVTVRISLLTDWISFIPTLLIANLVYYLALTSVNYEINYLYLFNNSIFTFVFYPILWVFFSLILNLTNS